MDMTLAKDKVVGERLNIFSHKPQLLSHGLEVITGASRGIGRATSIEFARHGARGLILHFYGDDATTEEIKSLKGELKEVNPACICTEVPGDIGERQTSLRIVTEGVKAFGRIGRSTFHHSAQFFD